MILFSSTDELKSFLPNVLREAPGTSPYLTKLAPFVDEAEAWVDSTVCPLSMLDRMPADHIADIRKIVGAETIRRAVPALDLVLTPNGFATLGNDTIAVASAHRTEALVRSMADRRDDALDHFLRTAHKIKGWTQTEQAKFFRRSLFFTLSPFRLRPELSRLEEWYEDSKLAVSVETNLAVSFYSAQLMDALRLERQSGTGSPMRRQVAAQIALVVDAVIHGNVSKIHNFDIVNIIRDCPEEFPEWHASELKALFRVEPFRNSRKSGGYFF
ncbi:MAG: hypothetical protein HDS67_02260 [Bacteroidales bacterium]|nr:hypothetical protein [Bacteroidales bacterium]